MQEFVDDVGARTLQACANLACESGVPVFGSPIYLKVLFDTVDESPSACFEPSRADDHVLHAWSIGSPDESSTSGSASRVPSHNDGICGGES